MLLFGRRIVCSWSLAPALFGNKYFEIVFQEKKHELRVSKNRALRKIFGSKREKVAGDWRRLHNEQLHKLYA
jgi:hypothetical protein